jgi:NADH-quinone oxidoreductase subunit M
MLVAYRKISLGETNARTSAFADLTTHEKTVLVPLVIMIFAIGIYPKPLMDIAEPSLQNLLNVIHGSILK